jgi:predicted esterase
MIDLCILYFILDYDILPNIFLFCCIIIFLGGIYDGEFMIFLRHVFFYFLLVFMSYNVFATDSYVYIFAHGLGGNNFQFIPYVNHGIMSSSCTIHSGNGPEVQGGQDQAVLGQERDVQIVIDKIKMAYRYDSGCKIILIGVSKGAATMINVIHTLSLKRSWRYTENIVGLILESPFYRMQEVYSCWWLPQIIRFNWLTSSILKNFFPSFNSEGLQPANSINSFENFNKNMIVVFAHSKMDALIPFDHSERMYEILRKQNFDNVYFLKKDQGAHANIFWNNNIEDLKMAYFSLWSIYEKHGFHMPLQNQSVFYQEFSSLTEEQKIEKVKIAQPEIRKSWSS